MSLRPHTVAWIYGGVALVLAAGAAMLQGPLEDVCRSTEASRQARQIARENPEYAVLSLAAGGLRGPVIAYLWIRAEDQKDEGRVYDSRQLAEIICSLQPRFAGAWSFHSWNMTYNISVTKYTPEERWYWVMSGLELLRDRGLQYNPKSLNLYRDLSWMFYHKMGGFTDDMHWYYKRRWASEFQRLLSPPAGGTTDGVLASFEPIAAAPIDRQPPARQTPLPWAALLTAMALAVAGLAVLAVPRLHGAFGFILAAVLIVAGGTVFAVSLAMRPAAQDAQALGEVRAIDQLLADPAARKYVQKAEQLGLAVAWDRGGELERQWGRQESLPDYYERFSDDPNLQVIRLVVPRIETPRDKALFDLVNVRDPVERAARDKVLAFVRAQILFHHFRMDPQWMLGLMRKFGPLDWRLVTPHSLYWATYGLHVCQGTALASLENIDTLNTTRHLLNSVKDLTWNGQVVYVENPDDPRQPFIERFLDPRFVEPLMTVYDAYARRAAEERNDPMERSLLKAGHINYLVAVMAMLYPLQEFDLAQKIHDYIVDNYHPEGDEWKLPLEDFILYRINREGTPIRDYANALINASLRKGYQLAAYGRDKAFEQNMRFAALVWQKHTSDASKNYALPPMADFQASTLAMMLVEPRAMGYALTLEQRSRLYNYSKIPDALRQRIYDRVAGPLQQQCQSAGIRFEAAFPEPPGMAQYRAANRAQLPPG